MFCDKESHNAYCRNKFLINHVMIVFYPSLSIIYAFCFFTQWMCGSQGGCSIHDIQWQQLLDLLHIYMIAYCPGKYTVGPQLSKLRLSKSLIIQTVMLTVLLGYFVDRCMFYKSILSQVYVLLEQFNVVLNKSMGFIYPNKFTYLMISTSVIQLAQKCSDN